MLARVSRDVYRMWDGVKNCMCVKVVAGEVSCEEGGYEGLRQPV